MLQIEIQVYKDRLLELKKQNPDGGFVVIKGGEILGAWNDRIEALGAGIQAYGDVVFLVKSLDGDRVLHFSRDIVFN